QALCLVISSLLTNQFHRYRYLLTIGRLLCIAGLILFTVAGAFPSETPRYAILAAFLLVGASEGTMVIIRGYIPRFSSIADRAKYMAVLTTAGLGPILLGPLTNVVFSSTVDDKSFRFASIEWDIFTLPCLILLAYNVVALFSTSQMKEPIRDTRSKSRTHSSFTERLLERVKIFRGVDAVLLFVLIAMKAISVGSFFAVLMTLLMHLKAVANVRDEMQVTLFSIGQISASIISAAFSVSYSIFNLGSKLFFHPLYTLIYSFLIFAGMGVISQPWPFASPITLSG
ncbi:hypothetical protein PMAYCL1PPCAC_30486, partial [Pristionchus mayeri]